MIAARCVGGTTQAGRLGTETIRAQRPNQAAQRGIELEADGERREDGLDQEDLDRLDRRRDGGVMARQTDKRRAPTVRARTAQP